MGPARARGLGTAVASVIVIVVLVVGAGGGYYAGISGVSSASTVTVTTSGSGAAGVSTQTTTVTVSSSGAGQTDAQLAQKECASVSTCLVLNSPLDPSDFAKYVAPAFYAQYPWANGKIVDTGGHTSDILSKSISEYQAGKVSADLVSISGATMYPIYLAGAIQNYSNPQLPFSGYSLAAGDYDPQGMWVTLNTAINVIVYNTDLMQPSQAPTSFADLAKPAYKGILTLESPSVLGADDAALYWMYTQEGNATWTQTMNAIAANQPLLSVSGSGAIDNIASGKAAVGIALYNDYLDAKGSGAHIALAPIQIAIAAPQLLSVLKNDPHPAMARLMEQFLISYSGQYAVAQTGRTPIPPAIQIAFNARPPNMNVTSGYPDASFFLHTSTWSSVFKSIFGT